MSEVIPSEKCILLLEEVKGGWRILHSAGLRNLYSTDILGSLYWGG